MSVTIFPLCSVRSKSPQALNEYQVHKSERLRSMEHVAEVIREFINHEVLAGQGNDLCETTPLLDLGILDSFALIALFSYLSERYGIQLDLSTIVPKNLETIAAIASMVQEARSKTTEIIR
jgi:clorobiocin biosynthesis protein CloN5